MNQITITFSSEADHDTARRQIAKAKAYAYRGGQLGPLGCALLLKTIERATDISPTTTKQAALEDLLWVAERFLQCRRNSGKGEKGSVQRWTKTELERSLLDLETHAQAAIEKTKGEKSK